MGPICIVCGRVFANLACITKEHVVPKSMTRESKAAQANYIPDENVAPSHYQCNNLRGTMSFMQAARLVDHIETKMSPGKFHVWLNKQVPNRIVPAVALQPLRQRQFMELPEFLPGM